MFIHPIAVSLQSVLKHSEHKAYTVFQPKSKTPLNRTLEQLNEQMTGKNMVQDTIEKNKQDTFESQLRQLLELKEDDLEEYDEASTVLLRFMHNTANFFRIAAKEREQNLQEYKNQLLAFDGTINTLQDMLDEKVPLDDGLTMEQAKILLEATRKARETFLYEGAKELNKFSNIDVNSQFYRLGNIEKEVPTHDDLYINPDAKNIYEEIDKAISSQHTVVKTYSNTCSMLGKIIDSREPYKRDGSRKSVTMEDFSEISRRPSYFYHISKQIEKDFRAMTSDLSHQELYPFGGRTKDLL